MSAQAPQRVDFYVLKSSAAKQRWTFACRLTEKAYLLNLKVVVALDNAADAAAVDDLLWTFNERSFVPHDLHPVPNANAAAAAPVRVTAALDAVDGADLLVNLSEQVPPRLERFGRIAEIIADDDEQRATGRTRFKTYRDLKLPVETHHDA